MDTAVDELILATKDVSNYASVKISAAVKAEDRKLQTDCDMLSATYDKQNMVYRNCGLMNESQKSKT